MDRQQTFDLGQDSYTQQPVRAQLASHDGTPTLTLDISPTPANKDGKVRADRVVECVQGGLQASQIASEAEGNHTLSGLSFAISGSAGGTPCEATRMHPIAAEVLSGIERADEGGYFHERVQAYLDMQAPRTLSHNDLLRPLQRAIEDKVGALSRDIPELKGKDGPAISQKLFRAVLAAQNGLLLPDTGSPESAARLAGAIRPVWEECLGEEKPALASYLTGEIAAAVNDAFPHIGRLCKAR